MNEVYAGRRFGYWASIAIAMLIMSSSGCAPAGVSRPPAEPSRTAKRPAPATEAHPPPGAGEARQYDLDAEMEREPFGGAERLEEDIEPQVNDAFEVEETLPVAPEAVYGIGYRVQVLASQDLEAAREMKRKISAGTGLAAYIEYENGLYKVRAGDFATREQASAARAALSGEYPGCWIVQTTIETGR